MSRMSISNIILCCLVIIVNGCMPASSSECLAESDHPYANNFEYTWEISKLGADQICLHFEYLQLAKSSEIQVFDKLIILDKNDNVLKTYKNSNVLETNTYGVNLPAFWTEWYTGDTLKVKLVTDSSGTANGFKIDKVDLRMDKTKESIVTSTELIYSDSSYALRQPVTLTAKVNIPSTETEEPSGTVTFMDGNTIIGTEDVNSGRTTLTTSSLSSGSHSITAKYSGDNIFEPSTSSSFTLTVLELTKSIDPEIRNNDQSDTSTDSPEENPIRDFIITVVGGIIVTLVGIII